MGKYWLRFLSALQTEMQYRANLVLWMIVGAIAPFTMVLVWFAVLRERPEIGGYDKSDFLLYYILVTIGWYIVGGEFSRPIGHAIKSGEINKTLLQPFSVVLGHAVWEQAWKLASLFLTLPSVILIIYLSRGIIDFTLDVAMLPYILLSLVAGALIFGLLQAMIGISAFWLTEVWPFAEMKYMLLQLLGGMLAPISILPPIIQTISYYLPFRYIFFEPIEIVLGKSVDPTGIILRQAVFVVILYVIYRLMWSAGIRKYEAIGG